VPTSWLNGGPITLANDILATYLMDLRLICFAKVQENKAPDDPLSGYPASRLAAPRGQGKSTLRAALVVWRTFDR
ncbi:hypothetical protein, partial [Mycolicibacterium holsaticum]|uniref:hypothetical protein n=1 Tax=Mycolicibacterium holsaticum TaxID=152142 RepID=UPI0022EC5A68